MRLLIVEDDEGLAELEAGIATELGFETEKARDGVSGIAALVASESGFGMVLLDYTLPDGDAPNLIESMKERGIPFPPFLVTTGAGDERIAVAMMKSGARDYLVKDAGFLDALPQALIRVARELETERCLEETRIALQVSEKLYRLIAENASDAIFLYVPSANRFKYVSPSVARLYGISEEDVRGRRIGDFVKPEEYGKLDQDLRSRIAKIRAGDDSRATAMYRATVERPRGGPMRLEVLTTLFINDAGEVEMLGVGRNVEERARMEEAITKSLAEKEVLLKEIHHRVKNNLQIVSSLIHLQIQGIKNKKATEALLDCQNRIHAMSLIHEQLYRSPNLADVAFGNYVRSLVPSLLQGYPYPVDVSYELSEDSLPLDMAVPCGLILNELVTNSVKHAFPCTEKPRLYIAFGRSPAGSEYRFDVIDNGPGCGIDPGSDSISTLGLTLVRSLVDQIAGKLESSDAGGARFSISFSAKD